MPEYQEEDRDSHDLADPNTGHGSFLRALFIARADIHRDKARERLHEGARHQHNETDQLARDAVTRGGLKAETVADKRCEPKEPQRKFPLAAALFDLRSYLPAERLASRLYKSTVYAVLPEKFLVGSVLRNAPALDHKNLLRRPHGFQAVRNH